MIDDVISDSKQRMQKSLDALKHELAKIRTGRAHPSLLEHVTVKYYGTDAESCRQHQCHRCAHPEFGSVTSTRPFATPTWASIRQRWARPSACRCRH